MKVKLNSGVEYWVSFYHSNHTNNSSKKLDNFEQKESYTKCIIENKTNPMTAGVGKAVLAKGDRFCKDMGRKLAMKRAMFGFGLNKQTRKLFWDEYFKMTNKK